jgi:hypothetical protein
MQIEFHEPVPEDPEARKKILYIRSAYRNDPDFSITRLERLGPVLDAPRVQKMIHNDVSVQHPAQLPALGFDQRGRSVWERPR